MPKGKRAGRGEGSIYQRKDRRNKQWVASFLVEETGRRQYLYRDTRKEAYDALHEALQAQKQGTLATGPKQKLKDYLVRWFDEVQKPDLRESSIQRYENCIYKHILPALGHIELQKLTAQQIQSFYNSKRKAGYAAESVITLHKVIHKALDNAVRWRLIPRNVSVLLLDTGMRHGEVTALRWSDINFEKGTVSIHRTVTHLVRKVSEGDPKTATSEREITLSPSVLAVLQEHHVRQRAMQQRVGEKWQDLGLVFSNDKGDYLQKPTTLSKFHRLLEKAGLPKIRIHDLRYTAVTLMMEMGINQKAIQHRVGHANLKQTWKYTHVSDTMQEEIASRLDTLLWGENPSK